MSAEHDHSPGSEHDRRQAHEHHAPPTTSAQRTALRGVLALTVALVAAEIVGGLLAHSVVLLADAVHLIADGAGVALSLLAVSFAARPATSSRTFGYQRAEILAAVANAVLLLVLGVGVVIESVHRLVNPGHSRPGLMAMFGLLGLLGNGASLALLHRTREHSMNMRAAYLEVASDMLGATGVLVAALVIATSHFERADAIAALFIGTLILPRTVTLLRQALDILLEATPRGVDLAEVRRHICETPGVISCHDLHAWTISSGTPVLSAHVVVAEHLWVDGTAPQVLDRLAECLAGHFDVEHSTFQLEPASHSSHESAHLHA